MGRNKKTETSKEIKAMDAIVKKNKKEIEVKELTIKEVEENYSDGSEYDRFRIQDEIKFYQEQAGYALIEIGKRLLRIRAHEEHGGFLQALQATGIAERTAQYAMLAARKFSNTQAPAGLGGEKLRALTVLEDEEIATLGSGGAVFGVTLDDIDRMSTRELRAHLRKEREKRKNEKEARESVIKQKEAKINELEEKLRYLPPATSRDEAKAKIDKIRKLFYEELRLAVFHYLRMNKLFNIAQATDGVDVLILEEFRNSFDKDFEDLEAARVQFFDNFDNYHILSKNEKVERGITVDNMGLDFLKDDVEY